MTYCRFTYWCFYYVIVIAIFRHETPGLNSSPTCSTKPVISRTGIFVAIAKNTLYGSKVYISFMPKITWILSKDHGPWRYFVHFHKFIKTHFFGLVICIAKNFIWTILKAIFSKCRFFFILFFFYRFSNSCISDCPSPTNHTPMERLFIQLSGDCINLNFEKSTLMTGFVV